MTSPVRILPLLAMTVVWVALWGNISWINVLSGLVIATVILVLFPLPPLASTLRPRPLGLVRLAGRFLLDLCVASVRVAALALRPRPIGPGAVIDVQLCLEDDLQRTIVAEMTSLVPGTVVIDLDPHTGVLTLHVLDVTDPSALDEEREAVHALEQRVAAAFRSGSAPAAAGNRTRGVPPAGRGPDRPTGKENGR